MIPILYPANVDLSKVGEYGGIGPLTEALTCVTRYEINGVQECTLTYPVTGTRYSDLTAGQIIGAATYHSRMGVGAFRIYKITRPIGGVVTINARQVAAYDLQGCLCKPFTASGLYDAFEKIRTHVVTSLPVGIYTSFDRTGAFELDRLASVWEVLGLLIQTYGGEIYTSQSSLYLMELLQLHTTAGEIRYGSNMLTLDHIFDIGDLYSGVLPYWEKTEDDVTNRIYGSIQRASGTYPVDRILSLDASGEFEEQPTLAQLNAYGASFITTSGVGVPVENLKVSFVELENFPEVYYGDFMKVYFPLMGITTEARVTGGEYNTLLDRFNSLTIGASRTNIAQTITNQQKEIAANASAISGQSSALSAAATRGDVAAAITAAQAIVAQTITAGALTIESKASGKVVTLDITGTGSATLPATPAAAVHCYETTAGGTAEITIDATGAITVTGPGGVVHITYLAI